MRCWNCGKKLPENAKDCGFCEMPVDLEPTQEEQNIVRGLLKHFSPEMIDELRAAAAESGTAEDFADRLLVGDCPKCGSAKTVNCEADPEIGELLMGRCYGCGHLWCTECGRPMKAGSLFCECWDEE